MKAKNHHKLFIIFLLLPGATISKIIAQDSVVAKPVMSVRYFLPENKVPYIDVSTKIKVGRIFEPVKNILRMACRFMFKVKDKYSLKRQ